MTTQLRLADLTVEPPPPSQRDWNPDGVVIIRHLMPEALMRSYEDVWKRENHARPGGWPDCTPYMRHPELLDLLSYSGFHHVLEELLGEPAGVHLNLSGWVSTERDWHQDTYLNPPHVGDRYAAVWIALETIKPTAGPFQYVPGSHRWPAVSNNKILAVLEPHERNHRWPKYSERILSPLFEEEIARRKAQVVSHLPERGDVLVWHGRLLHRGSKPTDRQLTRKALIAHYSGIHHRQDMPAAKRHVDKERNLDGWYFPLTGTSNV